MTIDVLLLGAMLGAIVGATAILRTAFANKQKINKKIIFVQLKIQCFSLSAFSTVWRISTCLLLTWLFLSSQERWGLTATGLNSEVHVTCIMRPHAHKRIYALMHSSWNGAGAEKHRVLNEMNVEVWTVNRYEQADEGKVYYSIDRQNTLLL